MGLIIIMNNNIQLTPHFTLAEFTRSGTAISRNIKNDPSNKEIERIRQLCENVLEPLRRRFGVIRITSGYRCPKLNKAVGGVATSQHLYGEAADIHISSVEQGVKMCGYLIENISFDQLILEHINREGSGWIHVSYKSDRNPNRHQYIREYTVDR